MFNLKGVKKCLVILIMKGERTCKVTKAKSDKEEEKMVFSDRLDNSFWQIARRISGNAHNQKDLVQEMWVHLLELEKSGELRGKTRSYFMCSCYFCAKHYLDSGKSVDSKRRGDIIIISLYNSIEFNDSYKNKGIISAIVDTGSSPEDIAIENILASEIRNNLKTKQLETFDLLLNNGYNISEIAIARGVDESTVRESIKSIRRIATKYLYPRN